MSQQKLERVTCKAVFLLAGRAWPFVHTAILWIFWSNEFFGWNTWQMPWSCGAKSLRDLSSSKVYTPSKESEPANSLYLACKIFWFRSLKIKSSNLWPSVDGNSCRRRRWSGSRREESWQSLFWPLLSPVLSTLPQVIIFILVHSLALLCRCGIFCL